MYPFYFYFYLRKFKTTFTFMKNLLSIIAITFSGLLVLSCGSGNNNGSANSSESAAPYDSIVGEGKFKDFKLASKVDDALAEKGNSIFSSKCISCHKLNEEKLVGPGLKGVLTRHQPAWIMNFITNTDVMLSKDPSAERQLIKCTIRMPNPMLSEEEAASVLEFMRKNDTQ